MLHQQWRSTRPPCRPYPGLHLVNRHQSLQHRVTKTYLIAPVDGSVIGAADTSTLARIVARFSRQATQVRDPLANTILALRLPGNIAVSRHHVPQLRVVVRPKAEARGQLDGGQLSHKRFVPTREVGFHPGDCLFDGTGDSDLLAIGVVDVDGEVPLDRNNLAALQANGDSGLVKGSGGAVNSLRHELATCSGRLADDVHTSKRARKPARRVMVGTILTDLVVLG